MNTWKRGDKAGCIKVAAGAWLTGQSPERAMETFPNGIPVRGEIYTVGGVNIWDGRTCLQIVEKPTVGVGGVDEGWAEYLFRKIVPASQQSTIEQEATP